MTRDLKEINKLFVKSMNAIAIDLDVPVVEVTKSRFFARNSENLSAWDIRKAGGFESLKKMNFIPADENLVVKYGSRLVRSHIEKVGRKFGQSTFLQEELLKSLEDLFSKYPARMHPKSKVCKPDRKKKCRTLLAHLSDTHFGSNIDHEELGGVNSFNWTIAARRTALFMQQIAQFKPQYRNDTDLVLAVNGDLVSGVIHDQEFVSDLWAVQFAGTLDIMTQAISYLANHFNEVRVEWTTGNHDRVMHKSNKGRASNQKWDSLSNTIAVAVKRILRSVPNVKINIPLTPYNIANIQGHLFLISHGDTFFQSGNVGNSINMRSINTQIAKLNASELGSGKKFSGVLLGHVHTSTVQLTELGCVLLINGCLSGTDGYAQSLGIFESHPTQQLVEVTREHAVGDIRMIQLKAADKNLSLDKIIQPFSGRLGL